MLLNELLISSKTNPYLQMKRHLPFLGLLLFLGLLAWPKQAVAQVYYLVVNNVAQGPDSLMRAVDTTTRQTVYKVGLTSPGSTCYGVFGLTTDPTTGTIYGIFQIQENGSFPRVLGTLNPITGVVTYIDTLNDYYNSLVCDGVGTLYGWVGNNSTNKQKMYTINKTNATTTLFRDFQARLPNNYRYPLTYVASNNSIYFYGQDTLYKLSAPYATSTLQKITTTTPSGTWINDYASSLIYNGNGNFTVGDYNQLARLDTASSNYVFLGSVKDTLAGENLTNINAMYGMLQVPCGPYFDHTLRSTTLSFCPGDSVKLSADTALSYQWMRNGVDIAGATGIDYYAKQAGKFNCRVKKGSCIDTASVALNVTTLNIPVVTLSVVPSNLFCSANDSVTITGAVAGSGTLKWYRNGVEIAGATGQTYVAKMPGNYNQLKTNANGCSDSAATAVTIDTASVVATFNASATTVTVGASVTFTNTSTCANSSNWAFGPSGATSSMMSPSYTYTAAGSFTVLLTSTNSLTSRSDTQTKVITVNPATGIANSAIQQIALFPNPTAGASNLEFTLLESANATISVMNLVGQTVWSQNLDVRAGVKQSLSIGNELPAGTYSVRLQAGDNARWSALFVKN
jgi:PKD repeat protein